MFLIIVIIAFLLIVLGLVALFFLGRYLLKDREGKETLEALDRRLAAGEIRKDEHERLSNLARSRTTAAGQGAKDVEK